MNTHVVLMIEMASWISHKSKLSRWHTLNMCNWLYVSYRQILHVFITYWKNIGFRVRYVSLNANSALMQTYLSHFSFECQLMFVHVGARIILCEDKNVSMVCCITHDNIYIILFLNLLPFLYPMGTLAFDTRPWIGMYVFMYML